MLPTLEPGRDAPDDVRVLLLCRQDVGPAHLAGQTALATFALSQMLQARQLEEGLWRAHAAHYAGWWARGGPVHSYHLEPAVFQRVVGIARALALPYANTGTVLLLGPGRATVLQPVLLALAQVEPCTVGVHRRPPYT